MALVGLNSKNRVPMVAKPVEIKRGEGKKMSRDNRSG